MTGPLCTVDFGVIRHSQPSHETAQTQAPRFSIVIPTLNEAAHIRLCLTALASTVPPSVPFEVLIIDNGSTDNTLELALSFAHILDLQLHQQILVSISSLRNLGASFARGDILVFLDADCIAPPQWIDKLATAFSAEVGTSIIGSRYRAPECSTWVAKAWERGQDGTVRRSVAYVPGGTMALRISVFQRLGGFDPTLVTNEDAELCRRARASAVEVIADPGLAVVHLGTSQTLTSFYCRQFWHGTHVTKVFLRAPLTSGNEKALLIAAYSSIMQVGIVASTYYYTSTGHALFLACALALLSAPAFYLACVRVESTRVWRDIPALFVLYLLYGLARSHCLVRQLITRRYQG